MTYYKVQKKNPRKYDFTKNTWTTVNYEELENDVLYTHIKLIDENNKKLDDIPIKYNQFLQEYKKIVKENSDFYNNDFHPFAAKNTIRKSKAYKHSKEKLMEMIEEEERKL